MLQRQAHNSRRSMAINHKEDMEALKVDLSNMNNSSPNLVNLDISNRANSRSSLLRTTSRHHLILLDRLSLDRGSA